MVIRFLSPRLNDPNKPSRFIVLLAVVENPGRLACPAICAVRTDIFAHPDHRAATADIGYRRPLTLSPLCSSVKVYLFLKKWSTYDRIYLAAYFWFYFGTSDCLSRPRDNG